MLEGPSRQGGLGGLRPRRPSPRVWLGPGAGFRVRWSTRHASAPSLPQHSSAAVSSNSSSHHRPKWKPRPVDAALPSPPPGDHQSPPCPCRWSPPGAALWSPCGAAPRCSGTTPSPSPPHEAVRAPAALQSVPGAPSAPPTIPRGRPCQAEPQTGPAESGFISPSLTGTRRGVARGHAGTRWGPQLGPRPRPPGPALRRRAAPDAGPGPGTRLPPSDGSPGGTRPRGPSTADGTADGQGRGHQNRAMGAPAPPPGAVGARLLTSSPSLQPPAPLRAPR